MIAHARPCESVFLPACLRGLARLPACALAPVSVRRWHACRHARPQARKHLHMRRNVSELLEEQRIAETAGLREQLRALKARTDGMHTRDAHAGRTLGMHT